jgi:hypothetical protein
MSDNSDDSLAIIVGILVVLVLAFLALSALLGLGAMIGAGNAMYNYGQALRNNIAFE